MRDKDKEWVFQYWDGVQTKLSNFISEDRKRMTAIEKKISALHNEIIELGDELEEAKRFDKFSIGSLSTRKVLRDLLKKLGFTLGIQERTATFKDHPDKLA